MMHRSFSKLPRALLVAALFTLTRPAVAALSDSEQRLLAAIQPARAAQEIQRIMRSADGIPQGVGAGSVVAGSAEEAALAEELAGTLRGLGLESRIETFPVRSYRYSEPVLEAHGRRIAAISLHAAGAVSGARDGVPFARGNEAGGTRLRVPLVDAGDGYAADYARIGEVHGKAVLVRREQRDWPPAQVTEAALHGVWPMQQEDRGHMAVGQVADFVVAGRNVLAVSLADLPGTRVLSTWIAGRRV